MEKAFSSINIEESHYNSIKFAAKYFVTNVKYKYVEKISWLRYISSLDFITTLEMSLDGEVRPVVVINQHPAVEVIQLYTIKIVHLEIHINS